MRAPSPAFAYHCGHIAVFAQHWWTQANTAIAGEQTDRSRSAHTIVHTSCEEDSQDTPVSDTAWASNFESSEGNIRASYDKSPADLMLQQQQPAR